jgi:hypothetical protein
LELQYDYDDDQVRLNGQPFDDSNLPRFENQYIKGGRVLWGQYHYTIKHDGHSLTHDFREIKDTTKTNPLVKRHIDSFEHDPSLIELLQCRPQIPIDGIGTSDRPSIAAAGSNSFTSLDYKPYMAWKGAEDDSGIYFSQNSTLFTDGWQAQQKILGVGTSCSPPWPYSMVKFTWHGKVRRMIAEYTILIWIEEFGFHKQKSKGLARQILQH